MAPIDSGALAVILRAISSYHLPRCYGQAPAEWFGHLPPARLETNPGDTTCPGKRLRSLHAWAVCGAKPLTLLDDGIVTDSIKFVTDMVTILL